MRFRLPASAIFRLLDQKVIAAISSEAKKCGWDQPHRGFRFYMASSMTKAFFLYYLRQMRSLDDLSSFLTHNPGARRQCGFERYAPSRSALSRVRRTVGSVHFEGLYAALLKILQDKGLLQGRILAIDSTFVKARSTRKGEVKPDFLLGKSCDFAKVGRTRQGFQLGYKLQLGVMTRHEIPVAAEIFPGNHSDYHGIEPVIKRIQPFVNPAIIPLMAVIFQSITANCWHACQQCA